MLKMSLKLGALGLTAAVVSLVNAAPQSADLAWRIKKDRWSEADERKFSQFVQTIGESRCRTTDECLRHPSNPYRASDPKEVKFYSDCADFPYALRMYFAWKNGLPFSYVADVASVEGGSDIRYTKKGNKVTKRQDVVAKKAGDFPNYLRVINQMGDTISSAMFRYHPSVDSDSLYTDHYPVKISRDAIRPGTVIYDPNGHVAMVYRVENDGRVLFMDAHPDNSITRGTYGKKFARSNPGMGAGFKNWRPLQLVGAQKDAQGNLIGGKVIATRNAQLADYSQEQFLGTRPSADGKWSAGVFAKGSDVLEYYDYVRLSLAAGDLKYDPVKELENMIDALCMDLHDRVTAVDLAISRGIQNKPHPERLPNNIYGTSGEWEDYSTPSRDARFKTSVKEMRDRVAEFLELDRQDSPRIQYSGWNLKRSLLNTYEERAGACEIKYTKSDGSVRELNLDQVIRRLFLLSFDPYHCVERRWGETEPRELSSCRDDRTKQRWYEGEQFMRNQIDRTYDARMDFTLGQIFTPAKGNGVQSAPDVDIRAVLN